MSLKRLLQDWLQIPKETPAPTSKQEIIKLRREVKEVITKLFEKSKETYGCVPAFYMDDPDAYDYLKDHVSLQIKRSIQDEVQNIKTEYQKNNKWILEEAEKKVVAKLDELIVPEEFIDQVVNRIKNKQLN